MRGFIKITVASCMALGLVSTARSGLELVEESSFTVGSLTGSIERIEFNKVGNGVPAVLASDGSRLVLYAYNDDVTLLDYQLAAPEGCQIVDYEIALGDINRDSKTDAILGLYCTATTWPLGITTEIHLFNGSSSFTQAYVASNFHEEDEDLYAWFGGGEHFGLTTLEVLDIDGDSYPNLLVSYDYIDCREVYFWIWYASTVGVANLYYSFPSAAIWQKELVISDVWPVGSNQLVGLRSSYSAKEGHGDPDYSGTERYPIILDHDGTVKQDLELPVPGGPYCTDALYIKSSSKCHNLYAGDVDPKTSGVEVFTDQAWYQYWVCYNGGDLLYMNRSGYEVLMYRLQPDGSVSLVWRSELGSSILSNFTGLPDMPGYLFAIRNDSLIQFSSTDGSQCASYGELPVGLKSWHHPYADNRLRLVVASGNEVFVYRIDLTTGTADDSDETSLPGAFALHDPYPNPFNSALTIPVSVNRLSHVSVEIFNIMGQKVACIWDGAMSAGERSLLWNGENYLGEPVSSGLYLIRAATESESRHVKCLLIK